jgi:hypothetical protein
MRAERRQSGAWVWMAALAWGSLAGGSWDASPRAAAQEAPEQQREKIRDQPSVGAPPSVGARSPAERREKIRSMSPAEKEVLLQNQKRLEKLDPTKRERLRDLCQQLEEDPHADELLQVMHRYYDWLRVHPHAQLVLAGLSPEKRVEKIKEMLKTEEPGLKSGKGPGLPPWPRGDGARRMPLPYGGRGVGILRGEDMEGVLKWQDKYVQRHGSEFLEKISLPFREQLKKQLDQATDELHRYEVLGMILLRWRLENPTAEAPLTDEDLKELRAGLSEATRHRLDSLPEAEQRREQWRTASGLIYRFVLWQAAARHGAPFPPVVSGEELAQFFQTGLSDEERAQLIKQPGERIARDLWERYARSKGLRSDVPPGYGPGGKRGEPRGPRRGPAFGPRDSSPPGKGGKGEKG